MRYEAVKELDTEGFKRLTGVSPEVFGQMVGILQQAETTKRKAGRPSKLCFEDKLLLTLSYWREYRTQFHIAASYAIHESSVNRIITHVEDVLIKSKAFSLPKRREVTESDWTVVLIDATETPIERPQKNKNITTADRPGRCRSVQDVGRKSATHLKSQVVVDVQSKQILSTAHGKGAEHDFALFKDHDPHLQPDVWVVADKGYQGLASRHSQTCLSLKKPRGGKLRPKDKAHNQALGRFRIPVEHVIRSLKIWRIVKETYRNRRKRFSLRFKLIAGLVNAHLEL